MANLSGGKREELKKAVAVMKGRYADRFVEFANMRYDDLNTPGFGKRVAARLEQDVRNGAQGLKIFKNFGMDLKYAGGLRVPQDDAAILLGCLNGAALKRPGLLKLARPY